MQDLVRRYLDKELSRRGFFSGMGAATRDGRAYLVEVEVARYGGGAESTWHEKFSLSDRRKRREPERKIGRDGPARAVDGVAYGALFLAEKQGRVPLRVIHAVESMPIRRGPLLPNQNSDQSG